MYCCFMDLGERFKKYRKKAGLTQKEASQVIGINSYQLGNYETNRSEPSITILKKMSNVYGVSIDTLVGNYKLPEEIADIKEKDNLEQIIKEFVEYCEGKK